MHASITHLLDPHIHISCSVFRFLLLLSLHLLRLVGLLPLLREKLITIAILVEDATCKVHHKIARIETVNVLIDELLLHNSSVLNDSVMGDHEMRKSVLLTVSESVVDPTVS